MHLPVSDLGIMAEHLATHEGVINKLKIYYNIVRSPVLKKLLNTHINVLRSHVRVMLVLIDPNQKGPFHLQSIEGINLKLDNETFSELEKDITLESRSTAKLMASDNFMSALMMKNSTVKHIHIDMALQDVRIQSFYEQIIRHINGEFIPKATEDVQLLTMQKYYHVLKE